MIRMQYLYTQITQCEFPVRLATCKFLTFHRVFGSKIIAMFSSWMKWFIL